MTEALPQRMPTEFINFPDILKNAVEIAMKKNEGDGANYYVRTNLFDLDKLLHGGLPKQELTILGGGKGAGKTSLALTIAANSSINFNTKTAIISTEENPTNLALRMLSAKAGISKERLFSGKMHQGEERRIRYAKNKLEECPLLIAQLPKPNLLEVCQKTRILKKNNGLDFLIIDRVDQITAIPRTPVSEILRDLAYELDCAVLGITATLPNSHFIKRNTIIEPADILIHIGQSRQEGQEGIANLSVLTNRNGPTGDISLLYNSQTGNYIDLEVYPN